MPAHPGPTGSTARPHWSRRRGLARLAALALAPLVPSLRAQALPAPSGRVLLSVSGRVARPNREGQAVFDMEMLAALPQLSLLQKTPWYPGEKRFSGPLLREVLALAGASGQTVEARALNDYKVSLPMQDLQRFDVILARLIDDQPIAVRDKGPLFIIYPFDKHEGLRTSVYFSRCVWQLKALDVR